MRILIISFFNSWITHFGTELELAQRHLDEGDEVEMLGCDGIIGCCDANTAGSKAICTQCVDTRIAGVEMLSKRIRLDYLNRYLSSETIQTADRLAKSLEDAESAKAIKDPGVDLGWGALSSTISALRDPDCDTDTAKHHLKSFASSAFRSYFATKEFLRKNDDYDRIFIFNGRFASTRGALRACQEVRVKEIYLHERGANKDKFALFENVFPHDREYIKMRAEQLWNDQTDDAAKMATAKEFYCNRRYGKPTGWKSFTERQVTGRLPENWDCRRRNIAIFNSSEDEFAAIGKEWKHPIYSTQRLGVARIVDGCCKNDPRAFFYLRVHPNLMQVKNKDLDTLLGLKHPQLSIILPDAPVCSYTLMDNVDSVLTFGSTMGIEATFWERPSILCSHAFYEDYDATYNATCHEEVLELLSQDLSPKPRLGALKYGYYMQTFGVEFKYWSAETFETGLFKGSRVYPEFTNEMMRSFIRATYAYPTLRRIVSKLGKTGRGFKSVLKGG